MQLEYEIAREIAEELQENGITEVNWNNIHDAVLKSTWEIADEIAQMLETEWGIFVNKD